MKRVRRFIVFLACCYYIVRLLIVVARLGFIESRSRRIIRVHERLESRQRNLESTCDKWLDERDELSK